MKIEFDPDKSKKNDRERGLPFDLIEDCEGEAAYLIMDERRD